MSSSASDPELLKATASGDARAFKALYKRHQPMVFRLAMGTLQNQDEAREVVQEVFVRLHRIAGRWTERAALTTWLHKTTVQQALNWRRTLMRFARRKAPSPLSSPSSPGPGLDGHRR